MKKKLISSGMTLFLVFLSVLALLVFSSNTFLGPYLKNWSKQQTVYRQMMQVVEAEESQWIGCYRLNETVYSAKIRYQGQDWLIWFDESLNLLDRREASGYDEAAIQTKAEELAIGDHTVTLGWFDDRPAVVLISESQEILLDYDTLDVVLRYKKKAV